VTTNYDDALESAFKEEDQKFDLIYYTAEEGQGGGFCYKPPGGNAELIKKPNEFLRPWLEQRPLILKIHGEVDRHNGERRTYAVTEDDYISYLSNKSINKYLPPKLVTRLQQSQLLFLGYRLLDWNLRVFYHRVFGDGKLPPNSWVIQTEMDPFDERFWESCDIKIVKVNQEKFIDKLKMRLEELPRAGSA
jgi:hypothetical protein